MSVAFYIKLDKDDNLEYALSQFLEVFTNAKRVGARWHLAVDY